MDGARFANAVASLGVSPADVTWRAGVDVLCFGGTKMGLPVGGRRWSSTAGLPADFAYRCKQAQTTGLEDALPVGALAGMLEGDAWLRHARPRQRDGTAAWPTGWRPRRATALPVEANGVFAALPDAALDGCGRAAGALHLHRRRGRVSYAPDTTPERVDALLADRGNDVMKSHCFCSACGAPLAPTPLAGRLRLACNGALRPCRMGQSAAGGGGARRARGSSCWRATMPGSPASSGW